MLYHVQLCQTTSVQCPVSWEYLLNCQLSLFPKLQRYSATEHFDVFLKIFLEARRMDSLTRNSKLCLVF